MPDYIALGVIADQAEAASRDAWSEAADAQARAAEKWDAVAAAERKVAAARAYLAEVEAGH